MTLKSLLLSGILIPAIAVLPTGIAPAQTAPPAAGEEDKSKKPARPRPGPAKPGVSPSAPPAAQPPSPGAQPPAVRPAPRPPAPPTAPPAAVPPRPAPPAAAPPTAPPAARPGVSPSPPATVPPPQPTAPQSTAPQPSAPPAATQTPAVAPGAAPQRPGQRLDRGDDRRFDRRDDRRPQQAPQAQPQPGPGAPAMRPGLNVPAATPIPAPSVIEVRPATAPAATPQGLQRLDDFRSQRRETRDGNRLIIQEPGRTIVREGDRTIIRRNEGARFRSTARDIRTERRGNETRTIAIRADGSRIVTVTDDTGRLVRRLRRDQRGREVVIIDNSRQPVGGGLAGIFINVAPPLVDIPRERYIVESRRADRALLYDTLVAPPVMAIERSYSLDEIRYSHNLRERMRRVDIDTVTFDTGSWELRSDQAASLEAIAGAIRQVIERNPNEVFLIEGHTDAVGLDIDNLSLSDRRAESVAVALTEKFGVPPENLTTQGYGEQHLKLPTDGPEEQNRRVTVRRITPLLAGR